MEKIFGKHSVRAVFLTRPGDIGRMVIAGRKEYYEDFIAMANEYGVPVESMPWPQFLKLGEFTEDDKHQGILAFAKDRPVYTEADLDLLAAGRCVFIMDQISNPQNLATIIRGAAFFGVDGIITTRNRAVGLTPTVVRYAVGGAEFVRVFLVTNLARTLEQLKALGYWVYGLDERGKKTLAQMDFAAKTAFVVGAEGQGLRLRTRQFCDELTRIPGGRRGLESLNAAVAASIAMAEIFRTAGD